MTPTTNLSCKLITSYANTREMLYVFLDQDDRKSLARTCRLFRDFLVGKITWITEKKNQDRFSCCSFSFLQPLIRSLSTTCKTHEFVTLGVLEISTGRTVRTLQTTGIESTDVEWGAYPSCITPDGEKILTQSPDCTLKLISFETGNCLASFKESETVSYMRITQDGKTAYTVTPSNDHIKHWNLETGECINTYITTFNSQEIEWISNDGIHGISRFRNKKAGGNIALAFFNLAEGRYVNYFRRKLDDSDTKLFKNIVSMQVSADEQSVYCLLEDPYLSCYWFAGWDLPVLNVDEGKHLFCEKISIPLTSKIISMQVNPDQKTAFFGCANGEVLFFNCETDQLKCDYRSAVHVDLVPVNETSAAFSSGMRLYNIRKQLSEGKISVNLAQREIEKLPKPIAKKVFENFDQIQSEKIDFLNTRASELLTLSRVLPTPAEMVQAIDRTIEQFKLTERMKRLRD